MRIYVVEQCINDGTLCTSNTYGIYQTLEAAKKDIKGMKLALLEFAEQINEMCMEDDLEDKFGGVLVYRFDCNVKGSGLHLSLNVFAQDLRD